MSTVYSTVYSRAFQDAVRRTLKWEGGYVDDPVDRGGATRYGITGHTLARYVIISGRNLRMEDLDHFEVLAIYHLLYWRRGHIWRMPEWSQAFMFDWMVHSGIHLATKLMQQVVGVVDDGWLGPKTLHAMRQEAGSVNKLAIRRMRHLCGIVQHDPTQSRFIKGWWRRVSSFIS